MQDRAETVLAQVERAISDVFGAPPERASVSFVGVEPIEILRFVAPDSVSLVSLGMSRRPMSADGGPIDEGGPRAELLVQIRGGGGQLWRRLAVLAAAPVVEGVVYSAGMTIDLGEPLDGSSSCTGGLVTAAVIAPVPVTIAAGRADPAGGARLSEVQILRFVPATSTELAFSRVHGSPALQDRWDREATDLLDLGRRAVRLD